MTASRTKVETGDGGASGFGSRHSQSIPGEVGPSPHQTPATTRAANSRQKAAAAKKARAAARASRTSRTNASRVSRLAGKLSKAAGLRASAAAKDKAKVRKVR